MWRLCVQANTHGIARKACTPTPVGARRGARSNMHAFDHVERRRRAKVLVELGAVEHEIAIRREAACGNGVHRREIRRRHGRPARGMRGGQRHGGEGALERTHRDRPQAVALIDDFALLGQSQDAANGAVRDTPSTRFSVRPPPRAGVPPRA